MKDKDIEDKLFWKDETYSSLCDRLKVLDKEIEKTHKSIEVHNPEKLEQSLDTLKSQENNLREQIKHITPEELQARIDKYNLALEQLTNATTRADIAARDLDDICQLKVTTKKYTRVGQKKELEERAMAAAAVSIEAKNEKERCQRIADEAKVGVEILHRLENIGKKIKDTERLLDYAKSGADHKKLGEMQREKVSLEQQRSHIFEAYKKKRKIRTWMIIIFVIIALFFLFPIL